jgi:hypothetical protein
LALKNPAVVLEHIETVIKVDCSPDSLAVTFNNSAAFADALKNWDVEGDFILITNHMGDCDAEFERGFFLAKTITSSNLTITVAASKEELPQLAGKNLACILAPLFSTFRGPAPALYRLAQALHT